jgi:hypothetical protein
MTDQQRVSTLAKNRAIKETAALTVPRTPKFKLTLLNILSYVIVVAAIALLGYVSYVLFYPFKPLVVNSVSITTPTVTPGGAIVYRINSCKNTNITPIIYKKIVSVSAAEAIPVTQGVLSKGCIIREVPMHIPMATLPGTYILYTDAVYQVSAIRVVHVYWHVGPFTVK